MTSASSSSAKSGVSLRWRILLPIFLLLLGAVIGLAGTGWRITTNFYAVQFHVSGGPIAADYADALAALGLRSANLGADGPLLRGVMHGGGWVEWRRKVRAIEEASFGGARLKVVSARRHYWALLRHDVPAASMSEPWDPAIMGK